MLKHIICITLFATVLYGCDDTPGPTDAIQDVSEVTSVSVSPNSIHFTEAEDGIKDTTLTIEVTAGINAVSGSLRPVLSVQHRDADSVIVKDTLAPSGSGQTYSATVELSMLTIDFSTYDIYVYAFDDQGNGNWAKSSVVVEGIPQEKPVIEKVYYPETIEIPESGSKAFGFIARVTDNEGQETISRVLFELYNDDGSFIQGYEMLDDGDTPNSGDETANDSLYTKALQISSTNNPDEYYFIITAEDESGLTSDPYRREFSIVD